MSEIMTAYAGWCRKQGTRLSCAPAPMALGLLLIVAVVLGVAFRQVVIDIGLCIAAAAAVTGLVVLAAGGHRSGLWRWCGRHLGRAFTACGAGRAGLPMRETIHSTVPDGYLVVGEYADGSPVVAGGWTAWRGDRDAVLGRYLRGLHAREDRLAGQVDALRSAAEAGPVLPPDTDYGLVVRAVSTGPGKGTGLADEPEGEDGLPVSWPACSLDGCPARWDGTCWHIPAGMTPLTDDPGHVLPVPPLPVRPLLDRGKWGSDEGLLREAQSIAGLS